MGTTHTWKLLCAGGFDHVQFDTGAKRPLIDQCREETAAALCMNCFVVAWNACLGMECGLLFVMILNRVPR
jgi:hypothetical protein